MKGLNLSPRPHKFRFYLDENFPVPAGKFLKTLGHNVLFAVNRRKRGLSDLRQMKYIVKDRRILMAWDRDFVCDEKYKRLIEKSPGILLLNTSSPNSEKAIIILKKSLKKITPRKINGKICLASIDKIKFQKSK